MLEEGKINSEEAARLLEALNSSESRKRHPHPFSFWQSIETIPDMVSSAMHSAFKDISSFEPVNYAKKEKIELRLVSGDINVKGIDTDTITVQKDGFGQVKEHDDTLEIKTFSGDVSITLPKHTNLIIKGVSGDLELSDIDGTIEIASVSGDITGKNLSGGIKADIVSGDVDLQYDKTDRIEIHAKTGDIVLRLVRDVAAEIEVETGEGDIECEFDLKDKVEKDDYLKGIINKTGGKIYIRNEYGDVAILRK